MTRTTFLCAVLSLTASTWALAPISAQAQTSAGTVYAPGAQGAVNTGGDFAGGVVTSRGVVAVPARPPQQGGYQDYRGGQVTSQGAVQAPPPPTPPAQGQ